MADLVRSSSNLDQTLRDFLPSSCDRQTYLSLMPAAEKDWTGEYNRFQKKLVSDFRSIDPSKCLDIIYPLFLHTFHEISLFNKDKAYEFYHANCTPFLGEADRFPIVKRLISAPPDEIKSLCKEPFEIRLLAPEHVVFVQTIKKTRCVYLALLMKKYLKIKILKPSASSDVPSATNLHLLARTVPALRNLKDALDTLDQSDKAQAPKLLLLRLSGGGDASGEVTCAQVCPGDYSILAAGCEDASVRLHSLVDRGQFWDPPGTRGVAGEPPGSQGGRHTTQVITLRGHLDRVTDLAFTQHPRYLLSSSVDKTIRLWDIKERQSIAVYRGHHYPIWSLAYSNTESNYFITGSHDRSCLLWTTERLFPLRQFVGHTTDVNCVTFHPNGRYVATGGADGQVRMYDVSASRCVRIFLSRPQTTSDPTVSTQTPVSSSVSPGFSPPILALTISPDGSKIAAGTRDGTIQVFDIAKEGLYLPTQPVSTQFSPVHSLTWTSSANGQYLVAACLSGEVSSWALSPISTASTTSVADPPGLPHHSPPSGTLHRASNSHWPQMRPVCLQYVPETSGRVFLVGQDRAFWDNESDRSPSDDRSGGQLPKLETAMDTRD